MPLTYDLSKIVDFKRLCYDGENLTGVTQSILLRTMTVEIGVITTESAGEFWARLSMLQKLGGAIWMDGEGNDVFVTLEDVIAHIGLITNVSRTTRKTWMAHTVSTLMDEECSKVYRIIFARHEEKAS